jgi:uncharacterized protein
MATAEIRFHGSLNDFLPARRRGATLTRSFAEPPGIVDAIQALGVPHTEVDLILVGGRPVGLAYRLMPGDSVDVFGVEREDLAAVAGGAQNARDSASATATGSAATTGPMATPEAAALPSLIPPAPDPPRFVLDGHLGRLARHLRMLGFDALYEARATDAELARTSAGEGRILLTRDRGLLKRSIVRLGYLVRSDDPRRQLEEVVARYRLAERAAPFTRCIRCNGTIEPVAKKGVLELLAGEPRTLRYFDRFGRCAGCGAVYWAGSHYERMSRLAREVLLGGDRMGENRDGEPSARRIE